MKQIAQEVREELLERFLRYVAIDTQSDERSETFPSTEKQLALLNMLKDELLALGVSNARLDQYGYVMASLPATPGYEEATQIGFIAHVDTSPDLSGADVRPQLINNYQGEDIRLGTSDYVLSPKQFPDLELHLGHDLITTDGTTLLGADDKAGVAEIMTFVAYLMRHPEVAHGPISIGFTPDEEIGRGVDHFDVKRFGAQYAYTVDGSQEGELEYENFNAASARIDVQGRNVHPGYAKGKMINALQVLHDIHSLLPEAMRPECTSGYEGFYHLIGMSGSVDQAHASYIIRDHDRALFEEKKAALERAVQTVNTKIGTRVATLELRDQYYNMREQVLPHWALIERAERAMERAGVRPLIRPIRGGTDGSRLSYMGLPCPNLFAGGMNFHGRYEYASLTTMCRAVATLVHLANLWRE